MTHTRRTYLLGASAVAAATAGVAGCLGGSGVDTSYNCELTDRDPVDSLPQPTVGSAEASVTVAIFEDFACPACRDFALDPLARLKEEFAGDDVAFHHYDFPIPVSDWSNRVANAARSVQDVLGDELFFEFSQEAYENQDQYSWQVIGDIAADIGADPCRVLSDASAETYDQVLTANRSTGVERGVEGTPGIVVGDEVVETRTYGAVSSEINAQLP